MESKKSKSFALTEEEIQYIEKYKKDHNLKNSSEALRDIIKNYRNSADTKEIIENVLDEMENRYLQKFQKVKYSLSATDVNIQTILEVLNTILISQNSLSYIPMSVVKSDVIREAQENIKETIANRQQRKNSNKYKKNKILKGE